MGFPWVSHGFPMGFPWVSHGFPMGFPRLRQGRQPLGAHQKGDPSGSRIQWWELGKWLLSMKCWGCWGLNGKFNLWIHGFIWNSWEISMNIINGICIWENDRTWTNRPNAVFLQQTMELITGGAVWSIPFLSRWTLGVLQVPKFDP